jgi:NAD(P)-dependent dehydrogenase (short-subunit alcohol dehydrogenase family)
MQHLRDKVAFITGGASGIGFGIGRACLDAGMKVVIADVRHNALESAAASLAANAGVVLPLVLDVTDRRQWTVCAARVRREYGRVDLLCSNAGVNFVGPTHEATYEDWDFAVGVNLGGTVNALRTFVPSMISAGRGGHIVITASVNGLFSGAGVGVYVTTKFALVGLAESLRADLQELGIGVSVLCPGPVKSELFESTQQVRPALFAATGSKPLLPPGVDRTDTAIF